MLQPPRAKHCKDCNCCILRVDHHCPFLNNCIGERNYAYFFAFLICLVLHSSMVLYGIVSRWTSHGPRACALAWEGCAASDAWLAAAVSALFVLVLCVQFCLSGALVFCHSILICSGRTTREMLSCNVQARDVERRGATLFAPRRPSLLEGAAGPIRLPRWALKGGAAL